MSITRQVAHNTILQLVGKIISTGLGLVAIAMMARYLGVEQFGWYTTVIYFLQFAGIISDLGMVPVSAQMLSEGRYEKTKLLKNLLSFRCFSSVVVLGIAPLIALFFPYPPEVKIAIAYSTISFVAIAMSQVFVGYLQSTLQMKIHVVGEIASRLVLISGLWLCIVFGFSFLPVMFAVILSSVTYTTVLWLKIKKQTNTAFAFDKQIWKSIMQKSWPIAISTMFNVIYLKGDVVILSWFDTQTVVGLYGTAYRIIDILTQVAMMIMGLMLPLLTTAWIQKNKDQFTQRLNRSFVLMMMVAIPTVVGTMILATPIITFIAGPDYAAAGTPLTILSLAVFGAFLGGVFGHAAVAIDKQKQTIWIYLSSAIITLCGYVYTIPIYGMYGAAWMSVFSEIYVGILLMITVRRLSGVEFVFWPFFNIMISSAVMGIVLYYTKSWPTLISCSVGVVVYAIGILLTKTVSKETIKEIIRLR